MEKSQYVARDSTRFPVRLASVKPPIEGLWYKGTWEQSLFDKTVAIVGSRRMSRYGKQVLAEIVPQFVARGYTTISGFMYGVDIEMHRLTVEAGGRTVGVFGWGIDAPIIPENMSLYHKVIERKGLFLSEFPPDMLGTLWSFPERNRIVVGLTDLVVVVEAGVHSGSLNSAAWGRKLGKPVMAVPGSIFSPVSAGCNLLLSKGWAQPLTDDFFDDKKYSKKVRKHRSKVDFTDSENTLVTLLTLEGPMSTNELSRRLVMPVGEVGAVLTSLSLRGGVMEERGVWVVT